MARPFAPDGHRLVPYELPGRWVTGLRLDVPTGFFRHGCTEADVWRALGAAVTMPAVEQPLEWETF